METAYYILKNDCKLHSDYIQHCVDTQLCFQESINNLKETFKDVPVVENNFRLDTFYVTRDSIITSFVIKPDYDKNDVSTYFKRTQHGGWFPKQTFKFGKELVSMFKRCIVKSKKLNPVPWMKYGLLFHSNKCSYASLIKIGEIVVLTWPYDEAKSDEPVIDDEFLNQIDHRIRPWEFQKMVEEYNQKVKEENLLRTTPQVEIPHV